MKNTAILFLTLLLSALSAFSQDFGQFSGSEFCAWGKQNRPQVYPKNLRINGSTKHTFDVLDYHLDLDIYHCYTLPYPKNFSARSVITLKAVTELSQIKLDAVNSSLAIQSVGMAGSGFQHADDTLVILLNRTYQPGDLVQVSIDYQHLNVSDNAFYTGNGFVFTDCEPQGARKWFPCYDQPYDKATLSLRAKVPANVKLGSNGRLADSVTFADTTWYHWISRDPIATYIMVISSRVNYNLEIVKWAKPAPAVDTLPIRFYSNPGENTSQAKALIVPLGNFFSSMFGEHPFEKDGFATLSPQFMWGGMENQTLTSLCPGCWQSGLIAHEFAHQWFGDMITNATWADLWLNEGFATYFEATWTGHLNGYSAYKNQINGNAAYYLSQNPGWAISNPEWAANPPANSTLFNYAITYMKGSCVMYMYRYVVGDSLFFKSIYDYANDTDFRYKSATIPDFIEKMNESTGLSLDWFFNQWIYQPNHPEYKNSYSFLEMGNGTWNAHFQASQVQTNPAFFAMPLELRIAFSDGSDTLLRVMNDFNNQVFIFQFDKEPVSLVFDPDNHILLKKASTELSIASPPQVSWLELSVNPNPATGITSLSFNLNSKSETEIAITDLNGRVVYASESVTRLPGRYSLPLKVDHLKSGTYLVSLRSNTNKQYTKLIVTGSR